MLARQGLHLARETIQLARPEEGRSDLTGAGLDLTARLERQALEVPEEIRTRPARRQVLSHAHREPEGAHEPFLGVRVQDNTPGHWDHPNLPE